MYKKILSILFVVFFIYGYTSPTTNAYQSVVENWVNQSTQQTVDYSYLNTHNYISTTVDINQNSFDYSGKPFYEMNLRPQDKSNMNYNITLGWIHKNYNYSLALKINYGSETNQYVASSENKLIIELPNTNLNTSSFQKKVNIRTILAKNLLYVTAQVDGDDTTYITQILDFNENQKSTLGYELYNIVKYLNTSGVLIVDYGLQENYIEDNPNSKFSILLPRDGFTQSQIDDMVTTVYFENIPADNAEDMQFEVFGYKSYSQYTRFTDVRYENGFATGFLKIEGKVSFNKPVTIKVNLTDKNGKLYTASTNVTCFDDFVDENKDGLDDRSNQDYYSPVDDINPRSLSDATNIFEWFQILGEGAVGVVKTLGDIAKTSSDGLSSFFSFFGKIFSFLPSEINTMLIFTFVAVIILRFFGR